MDFVMKRVNVALSVASTVVLAVRIAAAAADVALLEGASAR